MHSQTNRQTHTHTGSLTGRQYCLHDWSVSGNTLVQWVDCLRLMHYGRTGTALSKHICHVMTATSHLSPLLETCTLHARPTHVSVYTLTHTHTHLVSLTHSLHCLFPHPFSISHTVFCLFSQIYSPSNTFSHSSCEQAEGIIHVHTYMSSVCVCVCVREREKAREERERCV